MDLMGCNQIQMLVINGNAKTMLLALITYDEFKGAIISMKSYKAFRPDGFQPVFFKMYLKIIGCDVCNLVRTAFITGTIYS